MRRFLYFVLQLYVAVILTLLASDYVVTNRRLAQFQKMEDCCSTATEQYRAFVAVAQSASRLGSREASHGLSRAEKYQALASWSAALDSSIKDSPSLDWDIPGHNAADRLSRFLANRRITESTLATLIAKYREAGPDFDPTLTDDEEKQVAYLFKNLNYLNAVTEVARGQLQALLVKHAGSSQELEIYVVAHASVHADAEPAPGCSSLGGVKAASSLGREAIINSASQDLLECVRGAVHQKLSQITGVKG